MALLSHIAAWLLSMPRQLRPAQPPKCAGFFFASGLATPSAGAENSNRLDFYPASAQENWPEGASVARRSSTFAPPSPWRSPPSPFPATTAGVSRSPVRSPPSRPSSGGWDCGRFAPGRLAGVGFLFGDPAPFINSRFMASRVKSSSPDRRTNCCSSSTRSPLIPGFSPSFAYSRPSNLMPAFGPGFDHLEAWAGRQRAHRRVAPRRRRQHIELGIGSERQRMLVWCDPWRSYHRRRRDFRKRLSHQPSHWQHTRRSPLQNSRISSPPRRGRP